MKYFVIMESIGEYSDREVTPILILKDKLHARGKVDELTKKNKEDFTLDEKRLENWRLKYPHKSYHDYEESEDYTKSVDEKYFYIETVEGEE